MRMDNIFMKRLTRTVGIFLLLLGLLPLAAEHLPALAGIGCYGVHGGSMEPFLYDGDLVYASKAEPADLSSGDVVVYRDWLDGGSFIVHRVVENVREHGTVVTKGDANGSQDALPVPYGNIAGRMLFRVPNGGNVLAVAGSGSGACASFLLASSGAMLLVMSACVRKTRREGGT